jgi:hypothetical protein
LLTMFTRILCVPFAVSISGFFCGITYPPSESPLPPAENSLYPFFHALFTLAEFSAYSRSREKEKAQS